MRRRLKIIASAVFALLVVSGAAVAYWSTSGSGTGSAQAGNLTVSVATLGPADNATKLLVPGGTADAIVKVTNSNTYAITVMSVVGNGAITASAGCTTPAVTFANQPILTVAVPASTTQTVTLANAVSMGTTSSSDCQGAKFSIPVTVTVKK